MPPPRGSMKNMLETPSDYDMTTDVHNDTYPAISPLTGPPSNKSVVIIGASRGIGKAMAISFAQSGASQIAIGARPSTDLTPVKEAILEAAAKAGRPEPKVLCLKLEITSQASSEEAARAVESVFGKLDIVVHNAAVLQGMGLILDTDPEKWWETMEINLKGPYLFARAFLPLLLKGGDKTYIATSSCGATLTSAHASAYQISKTTVTRLMDFLSAGYGDQGVVAFSIHPGNVMTDMTEGVQEELLPIFVETPQLSADTITYLTKEKQDWLAGRYINCTWDMPQLLTKKDQIVKGDKLKIRLDWQL